MSSRPALAFTALLIGGLLGFLLGNFLGDRAPGPAAAGAEETPATALAPARTAPALPSRPASIPPMPNDAQCDPHEFARLQQRVAELESKAGLQQTMLDGYKAEKFGKPVTWPERHPPQYRDGFETTIKKAIRELGTEQIELAGVDCKEWPCIALVRNEDQSGHQSELTATATWRKNFGGSVRTGYSGFADCGDGRKERIELVSPVWDGKADLENLDADHWNKDMDRRFKDKDFERSEWEKNKSKRLRIRWDELRASWHCRPKD